MDDEGAFNIDMHNAYSKTISKIKSYFIYMYNTYSKKKLKFF